MTYNEWRDELKSNLLCVSESERRRVLDYYAEAYADRREAGFSEREIIDDFGAPYDAAQRILIESVDEDAKDKKPPATPVATPEKAREKPDEERKERDEEKTSPPAPSEPPARKKQKSHGWVFVLLCIIFCVPIFGLITGLVGITIGLIAAPFALVGSGATVMGASIGIMIGGDIAYGLYTLGGGFIALGAGIVLFPLFGKLVKLMWKIFKKVFGAIKTAFCGKECAV